MKPFASACSIVSFFLFFFFQLIILITLNDDGNLQVDIFFA